MQDALSPECCCDCDELKVTTGNAGMPSVSSMMLGLRQPSPVLDGTGNSMAQIKIEQLPAISGVTGCGYNIDPPYCIHIGQPAEIYKTGSSLSTGSVDKSRQKSKWCPPPLFIIMVSLLEVGVFVFDWRTIDEEMNNKLSNSMVSSESVLIYRPDRRMEIWRFVSYMVLHASWYSLAYNVVVQLLFGVPLEMVHGSVAIGVIYLAGVFAGSLGTSVVDAQVYLVGASGGVYALLAAQLANLLMNYAQMRFAFVQLVSVLLFVCCDLAYGVYTRQMGGVALGPAVSYIAHMTGGLAGFTVGLLLLKNFDRQSRSQLIWWMAFGAYLAFVTFAILFNLINSMTAQMLELKGQVMEQQLLHDLGIS